MCVFCLSGEIAYNISHFSLIQNKNRNSTAYNFIPNESRLSRQTETTQNKTEELVITYISNPELTNYLRGYNTLQSLENRPTFPRNIASVFRDEYA
jgi:hypothetical protein